MGNIIELGKVALSNKVIITDPCYTLDTGCVKILHTVRPGDYIGYLALADEEYGKYADGRIAEQYLVPDGMKITDLDCSKFEPIGDIGVDSGTAGIFNYNFFADIRNQESEKKITWKEFHDKIYKKNHPGVDANWTAGIVDGEGIVSSTGYGDGGYAIYGIIEDDEIVALNLVFMHPDEDEDMEDAEGYAVPEEKHIKQPEELTQEVLAYAVTMAKAIKAQYDTSQGTTALATLMDQAADLCDYIIENMEGYPNGKEN